MRRGKKLAWMEGWSVKRIEEGVRKHLISAEGQFVVLSEAVGCMRRLALVQQCVWFFFTIAKASANNRSAALISGAIETPRSAILGVDDGTLLKFRELFIRDGCRTKRGIG